MALPAQHGGPPDQYIVGSNIHRCLQRSGISRLPEGDGDEPRRSESKRYPLGDLHGDIAEVHTAEGKRYRLVAIDRNSEFAFVELHEETTHRRSGNVLKALAVAVPSKIRSVLTNNGMHFTAPSGHTRAPEEIKTMRAETVLFRYQPFEGACAGFQIERHRTKPRYPWPNGQIERMNHTITPEGVGPLSRRVCLEWAFYARFRRLRSNQ